MLKDSTESSRFQRLEFVQHLRDAIDEMFTSFKMYVKVVDYAEKESERQIIDWDRTYFLTKYYSI